jgi:hypothetical protein
MPLVSQRQYAKHRGVSHVAVQKAVREGRIRADAQGKVDPEQADRDWAQNTSPAKGGNVVELGPTGGAYAQSRAVRELYLAKLAKIEFEERTAKLVSRDEVTVTAFTKARTVRDSLLNIPDRVAALIAAETDPSTVHQILSDEIRKALIELSNEQRD